MNRVLGIILVYISMTAGAQVVNDNLSARLPLFINSIRNSTTVDCTVEWKCLNQSLTRSCIKYHNDQWFGFSVPDNKPYFLNVSGQVCQDIWGVQVLVFSGSPCEPSTYQLLNCHSDGNTDDVFIRLPPLNPGEEYLVNVDGYLHDLCSFDIELSDKPRGFPTGVQGDGVIQAEGNIARLVWKLDEAQAGQMENFEIWRSEGSGKPFHLIKTLAHEQNAFGDGRLEYMWTDTLNQEQAEYKVVGQMNHDRIMLLHDTLRLSPQLLNDLQENFIEVPVEFQNGEEIGLLIYNDEADTLLISEDFKNARAGDSRRYMIKEFIKTGIREYRAVVIRKSDWNKREYYFRK